MKTKNIVKIILITIGLFLIGSILGFLLEEYYRKFVRFLLKLFSDDKIQFVGKNIYLFGSCLLLNIYLPLLYLLSLKKSNKEKLKQSLLAIVLFFVTTILVVAIDSKLLLIECTTCDDGVLWLSHNGVSYNKYLIISLVVSLLYLVFRFLKKTK